MGRAFAKKEPIVKAKCRICRSSELVEFLDLGELHLSGYFPKPGVQISKARLALSRCKECKLVQLSDQFEIKSLYGEGYGYESHLNSSMRNHLQNSAKEIANRFNLNADDVVCDIASNDGTLLTGYDDNRIVLIGIDPLIEILNDCYPENSIKVPKFFSSAEYFNVTNKPAKVVTSFSVFYDLENPIEFASNVNEILAEDGVWILEQSYLPSMISTLGFDTVCHEHLLYLTLNDFCNIFSSVGFEIFDVKLNEINGGSIQVYVQKCGTGVQPIEKIVTELIEQELSSYIESDEKLIEFAKNVEAFKLSFKQYLLNLKDDGNEIFGLGASTKGNVLLQYCEIDDSLISSIGEINPKKFGCVTPGTFIPIVDEKILINSKRGFQSKRIGIIIPWHFENSMKSKLVDFVEEGGRLLVPLPQTKFV